MVNQRFLLLSSSCYFVSWSESTDCVSLLTMDFMMWKPGWECDDFSIFSAYIAAMRGVVWRFCLPKYVTSKVHSASSCIIHCIWLLVSEAEYSSIIIWYNNNIQWKFSYKSLCLFVHRSSNSFLIIVIILIFYILKC